MSKMFLVIGDWVIDENWMTDIYRSETSVRTGKKHLKANHPKGRSIWSLCGAGLTAQILSNIKTDKGYKKNLYNVVGMGIWNKEDNTVISAMLKGTSWTIDNAGNPYRLTQPKYDINKQSIINLEEIATKPKDKICTTRAVRFYHLENDKIKLDYRVDWNTKCNYEEKIKWDELDSLLDSKLDSNTPIEGIIINDLSKGLINEISLGKLISKFKKGNGNVPWYVMTKKWEKDHSLLKMLKDVNLRLLVFHPVATRKAAEQIKFFQWTMEKKHLPKDILDLANELRTELNEIKPPPLVVTLPDKMKYISRNCLDKGCYPISCKGYKECKENKNNANRMEKSDKIFIAHRNDNDSCDLYANTPMAATFLAALTVGLHEIIFKNDHAYKIESIIDRAFEISINWMNDEINLLKNLKTIREPISIDDFVSKAVKNEEENEAENEKHHYQIMCVNEEKSWDEALDDKGIISETLEHHTKYKLELWRSMPDVENYVCCVESKRTIIRTLLDELDNFVNTNPKDRTCKSFLIIAPPGSGKSYLMDCMAKKVFMEFHEFNITHMLTKDDIIDSFDIISTHQSQNKDKPCLVFFDEINSKLEGNSIYETFLSPIDNGTYVRGGKRYLLEPCVWVFVGTNLNPIDHKLDDFKSRLTHEYFDLTNDIINDPTNDVENVYLGAHLLRQRFKDVRSISENVLELFKVFGKGREMREIKRFVEAFEDIDNGKVTYNNIPFRWWAEHYHLVSTSQDFNHMLIEKKLSISEKIQNINNFHNDVDITKIWIEEQNRLQKWKMEQDLYLKWSSESRIEDFDIKEKKMVSIID